MLEAKPLAGEHWPLAQELADMPKGCCGAKEAFGSGIGAAFIGTACIGTTW